MVAGTLRRQRATALGSLAVAALGFALVAAGTRHGIGLSTDSAVYVAAARSLLAGDGLAVGGEPLTHFPPLYPVALAAAGRAAGDPVAGARWLHAALFAATVALVAVCVRTAAGGPFVASMLAALLVLACRSTLRVYLMAWSEALFLCLALAGFALLALHWSRPRAGLWVAAALVLAAALLTRYAGLALVPAAAVALLVRGPGPPRQRAFQAGALTAIALGPLALWLARNVAQTGSAANRSLAFHPPGLGPLEDGLRTLSFWVWPFQMGSLLGVAVGLVVLVWAVRAQLAARGGSPLRRLLWLFAASYGLFLGLSLCFVDADTPLRERVLSPLYVFGVVLLATLAAERVATFRSGAARLAAVAVGLALLGAHAVRGHELWSVAFEQGLGYSDLRWRSSELLQELRALPAAPPLYSNAPDVVVLLLQREARWLPRREDTAARRPNPDLARERAQLRADLERGARVAWFDVFAWREQLVDLAELEGELSLVRLQQLGDGAILGLAATAPTPRPPRPGLPAAPVRPPRTPGR
jgi:hypothetical protein